MKECKFCKQNTVKKKTIRVLKLVNAREVWVNEEIEQCEDKDCLQIQGETL